MQIGLDIGSTTIKCVVLDENGSITYKSYERHFSHIVEKAAEVWLRAQTAARALGTDPLEIPDAGLREIAATYNLPIDESMLD